MANTAWITAAGESSSVINAGVNVAPTSVLLWLDSVTSAQVRVMGTAFPKRVLYAGSFALATDSPQPSGANAISVVWSGSIKFEFEEVDFQAPNPINTNRMLWKLRPGVTCKFRVYW